MSTLARYAAGFASASLSSFLLDVGLKATALLLTAVIAAALLRRSSAALRHRLWCLTFAALLLLPGLSAALPKWRLAILPAEISARAVNEAAMTQASQPRDLAQVRRAGQTTLDLVDRANYEHAQPSAPASTEPHPAALMPEAAVTDSENALNRFATARRLSIAAMLWLLGAGLALLPLIVGAFRTFTLRRQARPIDDAMWRSWLEELSGRLALSRRVELLETEAATMPMTWGLLRPVVLLPSQAREWSAPLRRVVLLHELAHVKRCDVGFQMLGRVTCALYWFHPLVWYALRRLRIERELACDDCVVLSGERASDYAAELLQIAQTYRPVPLAAALAMAQRSNLEHRVRALFDRACSHLPVSARAARLLLVGVAVLVTTVAAVRLAPRAKAEVERQDSPENRNAEAKDDDLVTVSGRVVDPQGKPYEDARIFVVRWYWEPHIPHAPLAETKSGPDGRFSISYRKSQFSVNVGRAEQWREVAIVATTEGFGPGWVTWRDIPAGQEPTLELVPDDVPIIGRVVDLEGNPLPGVNVRVGSIHNGKEGNLDGWVQAVRRGEFPWTAVRHLGDSLPQFDAWPARVITGNDGRFRIDGIGRERQVEVSFAGPTIAYQRVTVVTRPCEPLQLKVSRMSDESTPVYGADFELVAPPTQPIVGVVRDAATGQPLGGVSIQSTQFAGSYYVDERHLRAVSDAQGRYRLVGMPKGEGNMLVAVPNDDQPYLMREFKVPESRGLEPVELDIKLHRGIWISGRVTDKATGEPLIARLHYLPFRSNEYAKQTPEFGELARGHGFQERYASRPDGSFRLVGLPGRAIVGALCLTGHYRDGVGAEAIDGMNDRGNFRTYRNPVTPGKKWPHAMKEINPSAGAKNVVCNLALDPGGRLAVNVMDDKNHPISGFETIGSGQAWYREPGERTSFDVITLGPDETRTVIVRHKQQKLGKVVRLRLTDHPTGAATLSLEPTAKVVGRLLNKEGEPVSGAEITAWILPIGDFTERLPPVTTDDQGRFDYDHIPVGCHYELNAQAAGSGATGWFGRDLALEPGETKDLGEVRLKPAGMKQQPPKEKENTSAARKPLEFRGRVVGPNGGGVANARVALAYFAYGGGRHADDPVETTTGEDGDFQLRLPASRAFGVSRWFVVATKDGYGPGWVDRKSSDRLSDLQLALAPDDTPIQGKFVDLEGRPVAGMQVRVSSLQRFADDDPQPYLDSLAQGKEHKFKDWRLALDADNPTSPILMTRTNEKGEFRLTGVGRNRLAKLELVGDGVEHSWIQVVTHPTDKTLTTPDSSPFSQRVYGLQFTHAMRPSRLITGVVTDAKTGQTITAARVSAFPGVGSVLTDAGGRFTLRGCPKDDEYRLFAHPPAGACYLTGSRTVADAPGLEPLETELHVYPAISAGGRVIDEKSGRPLAAHVTYYPLAPNSHMVTGVAGSGARAMGPFSECYTSADGAFSLAVLPGPGCLCVTCVEPEEFEPAKVDAVAFFDKAGVPYGTPEGLQKQRADVLFICALEDSWGAMPQSNFHGIALLNVAEDAEQVTQEITLKSKAK